MALPEIIRDIEARVKDTGDVMTGNLTFTANNVDRFIIFEESSQTAYDFRLGYSSAGSKDDNYFVIQSNKENNTNLIWSDALRIRLNSLEAGFGGNVIPLTDNTQNLGLDSKRWANIYATNFVGNASSSNSAQRLSSNSSLDYADAGLSWFDASMSAGNGVQVNDAPVTGWWHILRFNHKYTNGYYTDLAIPLHTPPLSLYYKIISAETLLRGWTEILDAQNYSKYALPINGNAATATALTTSAGSATLPIYFSSGKPVACGNSLAVSITGTSNFTKYLWSNLTMSWDGPGVQFVSGAVLTNNTTPTEEKAYLGVSGNYKVISTPSETYVNLSSDGKNDTANVQLLRLYWTSNYFTEISMSPNHSLLHVRGVRNGVSDSWKRLWKEGDSVTGAVWNDYAEFRESQDIEPGYCLIENGNDTLSKSTDRLQSFAGISSDTWGFAQGETESAKTPIAVAGRVLVYPYQDRENYQPGDCVCTGPDGKVDKMTEEEIINHPDKIIGVVSCVPTYSEWGGGSKPIDRPYRSMEGSGLECAKVSFLFDNDYRTKGVAA